MVVGTPGPRLSVTERGPGIAMTTQLRSSGAPTLEMVAAAAGVSRSTVSRVINSSPKVTAEAVAAVGRAIEELGYVPNRAARILASRRTLSIALVIPENTARFFADPQDVPRHVLTQGLGTIRDAGHLVLLASGEGKAAAVAAAVEGPLSASCPASVLQLHPHVSVVLDEAAASRLSTLEQHRETWQAKPSWQPL